MKKLFALVLTVLSAFELHADKYDLKSWMTTLKDEETIMLQLKESQEAFHQSHVQSLQEYTETCNKLSVDLFSMPEGFTLEATNTMHQTLSCYKDLCRNAEPSTEMNLRIKRDIERYQYLIETYRLLAPAMPPVPEVPDSVRHKISSNTLKFVGKLAKDDKSRFLSPEEVAWRDSSVVCACNLLRSYQELQQVMLDMQNDWEALRADFEPTYNYANASFELYQERIEKGMMRSLPAILQNFELYMSEVEGALTHRYINVCIEEEIEEYRQMNIILAVCFLLSILATLAVILVNKKSGKFGKFRENSAINGSLLFSFLAMVSMGIWSLHLDAEWCMLVIVTFCVFFLYSILIITSILCRESGQRARFCMIIYTPCLIYGFLMAGIRYCEFPDVLLNILVQVLSLAALAAQIVVMLRKWNKVEPLDSIISGVSIIVFTIMSVASCSGKVFMSMQLMWWWEMQQAAILMTVTLYKLLRSYGNNRLPVVIDQYKERCKKKGQVAISDRPIHLTWLYDLLMEVALPLLLLQTIPICIMLSMQFLNSTDAFQRIFEQSLFSFAIDDNGEAIFDISMMNFHQILSMFIIFRYAGKLLVEMYTQIRMYIELRRRGQVEFAKNQLNLTLGATIIKIFNWGIYIMVCFYILNIPFQTLSMIMAGLAAGIGFALKDTLNNAIYGMQLMAGRLRVGDIIECDGHRGTVSRISFQTTQIEDISGAVISFTNANLFQMNFQNRTRNNPYEVFRASCDVAYGTDIDKAREVMHEAIEGLNHKDKYGRYLISQKNGIKIEVRNLGSSGVQLDAKVHLLSSHMIEFRAAANEAIYKAFLANGIAIPFPQMDLHLIKEAANE